MKQEEIEVTYSYWDGSGHRKSVVVSITYISPNIQQLTISLHFFDYRVSCYLTSFDTSEKCKKGDEVGTFLEKCRQQFPELRGIGVDNLMYVKVRRHELVIDCRQLMYLVVQRRTS